VNYLIQVIRSGKVVGVDHVDEHPSEDYLDKLVALHAADYCDVSRIDQDPFEDQV
jgi:hypothetical protein